MKKIDFINGCKRAIKENSGIVVYSELPGIEDKELITNTAKDVENKMKYYDNTYDENMCHKHEPIKIVGLYIFDIKNAFDIDGIIK